MGQARFLTQTVQKEQRRTLMCFDDNRKIMWQSGVTYTEQEPTRKIILTAAGTPATDGKQVFACFGSAGVYTYDFEGKEVWHRDLGNLITCFGNAVSPVLYGDLCVVNFWS